MKEVRGPCNHPAARYRLAFRRIAAARKPRRGIQFSPYFHLSHLLSKRRGYGCGMVQGCSQTPLITPLTIVTIERMIAKRVDLYQNVP